MLRRIEDWLNARGYEMVPGRSYCCFHADKIITYRASDRKQTKLAGLMHECGHVLIGLSQKKPGLGVRYLRGYDEPRTGKARPNVSGADLLHEEIEAWHRGFALARRLGIRLDPENYWRDYGRCIKGYAAKVASRKI